jgi:hypothetical protein
MHRRLLIGLVLLLAAACQGPPPTQIVIVVTATLSPTTDAAAQTAATATVTATPSATATPSTPDPTSTPDPFPTPTITQIQVAEQVFEGGRMFWLEPTQEIWVMIVTDEGQGDWQIFRDTFVEGDPESDPDLEPPEGLLQPERGFGKLWRENPDLREGLGWAVTPEFGFVTTYAYHPGGSLTGDNTYVEGPGYHTLSSLYEEVFRFNEADFTWQLN